MVKLMKIDDILRRTKYHVKRILKHEFFRHVISEFVSLSREISNRMQSVFCLLFVQKY